MRKQWTDAIRPSAAHEVWYPELDGDIARGPFLLPLTRTEFRQVALFRVAALLDHRQFLEFRDRTVGTLIVVARKQYTKTASP